MRNPEDLTPISYGLNSTLRKHADGTIHEDVWKEGGLYGHAIKHIVNWLEKAAEVAENPQQTKIINLLISYYRTGNLHVFDQYSIEWLKEQEGRIDFINGFIEVYGDPLGIKASWEGIVTYKDLVATRLKTIRPLPRASARPRWWALLLMWSAQPCLVATNIPPLPLA